MISPRPICLVLERQEVCRAFSRACAKTGNRMAARMAMMAITTSNSISVKPVFPVLMFFLPWRVDIQTPHRVCRVGGLRNAAYDAPLPDKILMARIGSSDREHIVQEAAYI